MTESTKGGMTDNRKKFDELYQLHLNGDKESKKEYAEKFNRLSDYERRNYLEYQSNYDVFQKRKKDAAELSGKTKSRKVYDTEKEKNVKKDVSVVNFDEKLEFRKLKLQQKSLLQPQDMSKQEFDDMLDAAFEEMEKVDKTLESTGGDNFYKPKKFADVKWDLDTNGFSELIGPNEVELRFGTFKVIKGKQFFDSQVSKNQFENLMKYANPQNIPPEKSTVYMQNSGKYNIRIIEDADGKTLQRKSVVRTSNSEQFGVRLQASLEETLDSANISKMDLTSREFTVRQRMRWSFMIEDAIKLDMTKVVDPYDRKKIRYEVEVEILKVSNKFPNFNDMVERTALFYIKKMQNLARDSMNLLTNTNLNILMDNYNSIFTEFVKNDQVFEFPSETDMSMSAYRWGGGEPIEEELQVKKIEPYTFVNHENKPIAFDYKNIYNGFQYRVTPKLDGVRARIYIDLNATYIIDVKTGYAAYISPTISDLQGTVIDCEFYKGEYYPFDVLAYKGVNVIPQSFDVRFNNIRSSTIPGFNYSKPFYNSINPFDSIQECFSWMDKQDLEFDGLIFQRNDEPYWKAQYQTKSMKWKPLDEITVDLFTRILPEGNVEFYSVDPGVVGGNFSGMKLEYSGKDYNEYDIPADIAALGEFIAEYYFVDNEFELRYKQLRKDKVEPNFHKVVKSNRTTFFYDKVGKDDLLGYTLQSWRKWASLVKRTIVQDLVVEGSRVLDIGVGRGGGALYDLSKKCSKVYGIDPNKENLKELRERLEKFEPEQKDKIVVAKLRGQDTDEIVELIEQKVNVITMFFSISFFYESEDDFNALINTIDQACKKGTRDGKNGSMLIIQMMDGDKIFSMTGGKAMTFSSDKNSAGTTLYKIRTSASSSAEEFDTKLTISLPSETDTILGEKQNEWLASPKKLTDALAEIGFAVLSDDQMDKGAILPTSNLHFAGLNRTLIYIRGGGVMQKLTSQFHNYYNDEDEEDFLSPLGPDDMSTFTVYGKKTVDMKRVGVVAGKDSFLSSILYGISSTFRDDVSSREGKIKKIRNNLLTLLDKQVFDMMLDGNVAHNITFDTLYTKSHTTVVDGKQVEVVNDIESSKDVAFNKYLSIVKDGYVGHEIADVVGCFWNARINVYGEDGKTLYVANKKGSRVLNILKIANIGYEPLV